MLLGEEKKIPEIFREHELSTVNLLAPGKPMNEMIENRVLLLQGEYAKVIAGNQALRGMCQAMHYALVELYLDIQNAAAYEGMGKRAEATDCLTKAIFHAMEDGFILPFAENYRFIKELLGSIASAEEKAFIKQICSLGELLESRKNRKSNEKAKPTALSKLTNREYEIVKLMHERMSGKDIAEELYISEGSVKQYINQIYSKLQIEGDRRNKRKKLFEMLEN